MTTRVVGCPYCRADRHVSVRRAETHVEAYECATCSGHFAVRWEVHVKATALTIEGEVTRVADEIDERLAEERERSRT